MKPIAMTCSYADFKLIRTRSVAQIVLEIDIDKAEDFVTAFGLPLPGKERPVALALLNSEPPAGGAVETTGLTQSPPPRPSREGPQGCPTAAPDKLVQYVAIACGDPRFQAWLKHYAAVGADRPFDQQDAAVVVRGLLGVRSRAEISTNPAARQKALDLMTDYEIHIGKHAENRA